MFENACEDKIEHQNPKYQIEWSFSLWDDFPFFLYSTIPSYSVKTKIVTSAWLTDMTFSLQNKKKLDFLAAIQSIPSPKNPTHLFNGFTTDGEKKTNLLNNFIKPKHFPIPSHICLGDMKLCMGKPALSRVETRRKQIRQTKKQEWMEFFFFRLFPIIYKTWMIYITATTNNDSWVCKVF